MNCTLTVAQQKLLFGKVAIDLKNTGKFDLKTYAKDFHSLILNKTGDKVLAANYVALLPMNIRAVMGVNKAIFRKLAGVAGQISDYEAQFENFDNVEKFLNEVVISTADLTQLEKTIQKDSLTKPPQQEQAETTPITVRITQIQEVGSSQAIQAFDKANAQKGIDRNTALKEFKQNFPTLADKVKTITGNFNDIVKHLKETQNLVEKC